MLTTGNKMLIVAGALAACGTAGFFVRRRVGRGRTLAEAAYGIDVAGVLEVAADAFMSNGIKDGEQVLAELPEKDRTIARCTVAKKRRYEKGPDWKGWVQRSEYRLYKPLVADSLFGAGEPIQYPYTNVTVVAHKTTNTRDDSITDYITVLGDLGATAKYPEGEYRYLLSNQVDGTPSHKKVLRGLGYTVVVPCGNVPLSGRVRRRRKR